MNNIQNLINILQKSNTNITTHSRTSEWVLNSMNQQFTPEPLTPTGSSNKIETKREQQPQIKQEAQAQPADSTNNINSILNSIVNSHKNSNNSSQVNKNDQTNDQLNNLLAGFMNQSNQSTTLPSFTGNVLSDTLQNAMSNGGNNMPIIKQEVTESSRKSPTKYHTANRNAAKQLNNEHNLLTKSLDEPMKRHYNLLSVLCRLCGEICGGINPNTKKRSYAEEIRVLYNLDIENDKPLVHPNKICYKCRSLLDRIRKRIKHNKELKEINARPPCDFYEHDENCKICIAACPVCFIYDVNMRPGEDPAFYDDVGSDDGEPKIKEIEEDGNGHQENGHQGCCSHDASEDNKNAGSAACSPKPSSQNEPNKVSSVLDNFFSMTQNQGSSASPSTYGLPNMSLATEPIKFTIKKQNISNMNFKTQVSKLKIENVENSVVLAGNDLITPKGTEDRHKILLQSVCRLCGGLAIKCREKEHFGEQINRLCGIDPQNDDIDIHPKYVCSLCCKKFYYRSSHVRPAAQFRSPIDLKEFWEHNDSCPTCYQDCPLCQINPTTKYTQIKIAIDRKAIKEHIAREALALENEKKGITGNEKSPISFNDNLFGSSSAGVNPTITTNSTSPLTASIPAVVAPALPQFNLNNTASTLSGTNHLQSNLNSLNNSQNLLPESPSKMPAKTHLNLLAGNSNNVKLQELLAQLTNKGQNQAIPNPSASLPTIQLPQPPIQPQTQTSLPIPVTLGAGTTTPPSGQVGPSLANMTNLANNLINLKSNSPNDMNNQALMQLKKTLAQTQTQKPVVNGAKNANSSLVSPSGININNVAFGKAPATVVKKFEELVLRQKSLSGVIEVLVSR